MAEALVERGKPAVATIQRVRVEPDADDRAGKGGWGGEQLCEIVIEIGEKHPIKAMRSNEGGGLIDDVRRAGRNGLDGPEVGKIQSATGKVGALLWDSPLESGRKSPAK